MDKYSGLPHLRSVKKRLSVSIAEIALICVYFLTAQYLSVEWLESEVGSIALFLASNINPFLSAYSISFADNKSYFIHCHVLATVMAPMAFFAIIKRNGGWGLTRSQFINFISKKGIFRIMVVMVIPISTPIVLLWGVSHPLDGVEKNVWGNDFHVCLFAFMQGWLVALFAFFSFGIVSAFVKTFSLRR